MGRKEGKGRKRVCEEIKPQGVVLHCLHSRGGGGESRKRQRQGGKEKEERRRKKEGGGREGERGIN